MSPHCENIESEEFLEDGLGVGVGLEVFTMTKFPGSDSSLLL